MTRLNKSRFNVGDEAALRKAYVPFGENQVVVVTDPYKKGESHSIEVMDMTDKKDKEGVKARVPIKYLRKA